MYSMFGIIVDVVYAIVKKCVCRLLCCSRKRARFFDPTAQ